LGRFDGEARVLPETRYARSGDVSIAYQVSGEGPRDLLTVSGSYSNVEIAWESPRNHRFFTRLSSFARLIRFDKRGTGLSDRTGIAPLDTRMDDLRAVMDAAGSERAAILAFSEGGALAILFAATYPERAAALILVATTAGLASVENYPTGWRPADFHRLEDSPADETSRLKLNRALLGPLADDVSFLRWYERYARLSVSPSNLAAMAQMAAELDVRPVLPSVRVPTLVVHSRNDPILDIAHGRYLAEHIPGAKFVEFTGASHITWFSDADRLVEEVARFVTGMRPVEPAERVLATVLFTDIVASTETAASLGDQRWQDLLGQHNAFVRRNLDRFCGREIKTIGDGFLATFDGPGRAVQCARAIAEDVRSIGLRVRAGVHTGECEMTSGELGGIAVHIGARVAGLAGPDEVLVSSTVKDLVAGSGLSFIDRGVQKLKGMPEAWHLYALAR
jgi:pimeloyl-ACP methyl ester carboxylesterase